MGSFANNIGVIVVFEVAPDSPQLSVGSWNSNLPIDIIEVWDVPARPSSIEPLNLVWDNAPSVGFEVCIPVKSRTKSRSSSWRLASHFSTVVCSHLFSKLVTCQYNQNEAEANYEGLHLFFGPLRLKLILISNFRIA